MGDVTIQTVQACLGLDRGEVVTVGYTPFVKALIDGGRVLHINPETGAPWPPPWGCPLCLVERTDAEGPGLWLPECPNCGTTVAPEQGV